MTRDLALDVGVARLVQDRLGGVVIGGRHDHMARVADAPAADGPQVYAALSQRLREGRHRPGLILQLDDELVGHRG
ncbi:MAG: hypothetical protein WKF78_00810 [Candidatus Limnocylindrales bacterium]